MDEINEINKNFEVKMGGIGLKELFSNGNI